MGQYSKSKGSSFERLVAKMIAKAFDVPVKECYRTPMSGGHYIKGDIVLSPALQVQFPFTIECKHTKSWSLSHLIPLSALMKSWLAQAFEQAKDEGHNPLLIIRGNHTPVYAITVTALLNKTCAVYRDYLRFTWKAQELVFLPFDALLKWYLTK
jgi:hypothetical protein